MSRNESLVLGIAEKALKRAKTLNEKLEAKREIAALEVRHQGNTLRLATQPRGTDTS